MTKEQLAIVEKYELEILAIKSNCRGDNEAAHVHADALLRRALDELGFNRLSDAWEEVAEMGFWYA